MLKCDALKKALKIEGMEGDFYRNCIGKATDSEGRDTFKRLLEEKESHILDIQNALATVKETGTSRVYEETMVKVIPEEPGRDYDVIDAINVCIDTSQKTMELYEELGLDELRKKEEYLIQELEEDMNSLTKTGDWWDFRVVGH
ncbi:MAG: hypothetical protein U9M95_06550 [Candidatus Altiarchaeota archaeon]|nr:hypothetical protein [Candidatus Altiarchaeota archaeon]